MNGNGNGRDGPIAVLFEVVARKKAHGNTLIQVSLSLGAYERGIAGLNAFEQFILTTESGMNHTCFAFHEN